jgi:hypothetical protein
MNSSKSSSTWTLDSVHSCQLCPLIKLEVGVEFSTVTLPFSQVFLSARDGCRFLNERLKRIVPPSSWMYQNDACPLLDLFYEISLQITTSLTDGRCIVNCEWQLPDGPWDDCIEDSLLAYTKRGRSIAILPDRLGADKLESDGLAAHYIKTRPPNQYPLSPENIQWMRHSLRRCHRNHATCNNLRQEMRSHKLPKYMLDLRSSDDGQVRIIETQGRNMAYAILSYCWGRDPTILKASKTTLKNTDVVLDSLMNNKQIQDATILAI